MSQCASRRTPRWSVSGQPTLVPALVAGLERGIARVRVGPPLLANGPICGLTLFWSPGPVKFTQVASLLKLYPSDEKTSCMSQLLLPVLLVLLARSVFFMPSVPRLRRPPPLL